MRLIVVNSSLWLIIASTALTLGCRGSIPFGRTVQITKSSDAAEISIDSPEQRLATGKSEDLTDPTDQEQQLSEELALEMPESAEPIPPEVSVAVVADTVLGLGEKAQENTESDADAPMKSGDIALVGGEEHSNAGDSDSKQSPAEGAELVGDLPTNEVALTAGGQEPDSQPLPELTSGMSAGELLDALQQYPTDQREQAVNRFVNLVADTASQTKRPNSVSDEIAKALDGDLTLPEVTIKEGLESPERIASSTGEPEPAPAVSTAISFSLSDDKTDDVVVADLLQKETENTPPDNNLGKPVTEVATQQTVAVPEVVAEENAVTEALRESAEETPIADVAQVSVESPAMPQSEPAIPLDNQAINQLTAVDQLTEGQLLAALILSLQKASDKESESERHDRLVKLSHLMVLAGDLETAVDSMEDVTSEERDFLRHQLRGLWHLIDPAGHPNPNRRFTSVASEFREAAKHAGAATDSLEVSRLVFCTEIEAYGQVKPFKKNQFEPGQQVILYCEVENFKARQLDTGYEMHLKGSYEIFDAENQRVFDQVLPADRQDSANYLRDYFVAYQMFLPANLPAGQYRLQLTMEDLVGKKYGQAEVSFEIEE